MVPVNRYARVLVQRAAVSNCARGVHSAVALLGCSETGHRKPFAVEVLADYGVGEVVRLVSVVVPLVLFVSLRVDGAFVAVDSLVVGQVGQLYVGGRYGSNSSVERRYFAYPYKCITVA